jgi:hypothetical protein
MRGQRHRRPRGHPAPFALRSGAQHPQVRADPIRTREGLEPQTATKVWPSLVMSSRGQHAFSRLKSKVRADAATPAATLAEAESCIQFPSAATFRARLPLAARLAQRLQRAIPVAPELHCGDVVGDARYRSTDGAARILRQLPLPAFGPRLTPVSRIRAVLRPVMPKLVDFAAGSAGDGWPGTDQALPRHTASVGSRSRRQNGLLPGHGTGSRTAR